MVRLALAWVGPFTYYYIIILLLFDLPPDEMSTSQICPLSQFFAFLQTIKIIIPKENNFIHNHKITTRNLTHKWKNFISMNMYIVNLDRI